MNHFNQKLVRVIVSKERNQEDGVQNFWVINLQTAQRKEMEARQEDHSLARPRLSRHLLNVCDPPLFP